MKYRNRAKFASLTAVLLLVAACDAEDLGTEPGEDVYGIWELNGEPLYLHLEEEQITIYDAHEVAACYNVFVYPVIDREGDIFTIEENGEETTAEIRRVGDGLVIASETDQATYDWAGDVDLEDLTEC